MAMLVCRCSRLKSGNINVDLTGRQESMEVRLKLSAPVFSFMHWLTWKLAYNYRVKLSQEPIPFFPRPAILANPWQSLDVEMGKRKWFCWPKCRRIYWVQISNSENESNKCTSEKGKVTGTHLSYTTWFSAFFFRPEGRLRVFLADCLFIYLIIIQSRILSWETWGVSFKVVALTPDSSEGKRFIDCCLWPSSRRCWPTFGRLI